MVGKPLDRQTADWLMTIDDKLRKRLAATGLIAAPQRSRLGDFLDKFILNRADVKPATLEIWKQPARNLKEFFNSEKPLRAITPGDAEQFKQWLSVRTGPSGEKLAPATQAKRLAFARTFFHTARKHKLIEENPFADVKIPSADVSKRQAYVTRENAIKMIEKATPTWRTIIALCRFGGLRCPSEVLSLRLDAIDWDRNRIKVASPKTDRYDGKGSREIPLFVELKPYLLEAAELAEEGQEYVVGGDYREKADSPKGWRSVNLRKPLMALIARAGIKTWPRLFHNLRASCETDLMEEYPIQVVAKWMGHDPKVTLKHYAQTTDEHFERAAGGSESDAKSDARFARSDAKSDALPARAETCQDLNSFNITGKSTLLHVSASSETFLQSKTKRRGRETTLPILEVHDISLLTTLSH
jgi:integrase